MAGSYFQNHSFGISAIDLSEMSNTEKFLGSAIGVKTSKSDAGYLDITNGKTYSLKQVLQMRKVVKLKGNRETVAITFGGTVATSEQVVTIDGIPLTVTPSAATGAGLASAVETAVKADDTLKVRWETSVSSATLTLKSLKEDGNRSYDETNYSASASAVTVALVHTLWGANKVTLALYTADSDTEASPEKILEIVSSVADLADNGQVEYEITLPPNCKRYIMLGIKKATATDILLGTSVFPVTPIMG